MIGIACFIVTGFQLGLDQMPDASSSDITSFIAWFVFCLCAGCWISAHFVYTYQICIPQNLTTAIKISSFHPVAFISAILVSDFVFVKDWLIIEPKVGTVFKNYLSSSQICCQAQGSSQPQCFHILGGRHTFPNRPRQVKVWWTLYY